MKIKHFGFSIFSAAVFTAWTAHAGIVMLSEQTMSMRGQPMVSQGKVYVDQDKSRVELSGGMLGGQVMIYRKDKDVMWMIDTKNNSYTETSMSDLQKAPAEMEEKMKAMRAKMAAQGIKLPPTPAAPAKPTFQKVASGEKVGAWVCDRYEGMTDGRKSQDIWVTSPSSVGLSDADFQMMKKLAGSAKNGQSAMPFFGDDALAGIPVKFVYYSASGETVSNVVKEVSRQDTPSGLFELPAGAKKNAVPNFQFPQH